MRNFPADVPAPGEGPSARKRFLGIPSQEWPRVGLLLLSYFLITGAFWIQKPIRASKFLIAIGPRGIPLAQLGSTLLILPLLLLYSSRKGRSPNPRLIAGTVAAFAAASLLCWRYVSAGSAAWVHYAYYFYLDLYPTILVALFWTLVHDITPPRHAGQTYSLVSLGGIIGGIGGSTLTGWCVRAMGTANLLLVCTGMLLAVTILVQSLARFSRLDSAAAPEKPSQPLAVMFTGARLTWCHPYLFSICGIVGCYEIISTIVNYQFSAAACHAFADEVALAAFLGRLSSITLALSMTLQAAWVLRPSGPRSSLVIPPLVMGLGSLLFLLMPGFVFATFLSASDGSLQYSLYQTSKEVCYSATDEAVRSQSKLFIDMFFRRFAKTFSALMIALCNLWLVPWKSGAHLMTLLSLLIIPVWVLCAQRAGRRLSRWMPIEPAIPAVGPRL